MKKVFLEDLPRRAGFGANKCKEVIDWNLINEKSQKI